jgi:hypothetical protein
MRSLLERIARECRLRGKKHALLAFLFQNAIDAEFEPIHSDKIMAAVKPAFPSVDAFYTSLHELKEVLRNYFDARQEGIGKEPVRVEIEDKTHLLFFPRNQRIDSSIQELWEPYFRSIQPALIYYPEPQFFKYGSNLYVRHLQINSPDEREHINRYLNRGAALQDAVPSTSFVPSGLVAAYARLAEAFAAYSCVLKASVIRTSHHELPSTNCNKVILAIPTSSAGLIDSLQQNLPMRSQFRRTGSEALRNEVQIVGANGRHTRLTDESQDKENARDVSLTKWAVVTRRRDVPSGCHLTLITGHSRSVQGVAEFLTHDAGVSELKTKFGGAFPAEFQVAFKVRMNKVWNGELRITSTEIGYLHPHQEKATAAV